MQALAHTMGITTKDVEVCAFITAYCNHDWGDRGATQFHLDDFLPHSEMIFDIFSPHTGIRTIHFSMGMGDEGGPAAVLLMFRQVLRPNKAYDWVTEVWEYIGNLYDFDTICEPLPITKI